MQDLLTDRKAASARQDSETSQHRSRNSIVAIQLHVKGARSLTDLLVSSLSTKKHLGSNRDVEVETGWPL